MLKVHLDPSTHMASRRPEAIQAHVDWLARRVGPASPGSPPHILDVGCGPGLYLFELARRGYRTTGFDFSPAAIAWAEQQAEARHLDCRFHAWDLTRLPADLPQRTGPLDAVTFWFGEFHSFDPQQVRDFLPRLAASLKPGGLFILEYQPWDVFVQDDGTQWSWASRSPFCDEPHLWLQEFGWDAAARAEVHVHWIIRADSGKVTPYRQCHFAWPQEELVSVLAESGLVDPEYHPPVAGIDEEFEFPVLVARRADL